MAVDIQAIQDAKDALNEEKAPHAEFMRVAMHGEAFLVSVDAVLSVVRPSVITPVPMAPDHLIGVANVRGQVFCIVNPGKLLKLSDEIKEKTKDTRFLLLRHDRVHMGIWVDAITELHSVPKTEVPADSGDKFIRGHLTFGADKLPILRVNVLFD